ncbi:MAG: DUF2156 domain-containing protein [Ruminococcaceae bacterium]|nr:DUF2156 domain-containing protein [Oscillospiraceae bacterium]
MSVQSIAKIDFKPVALSDKDLYENYLSESGERGCEFSFANLYLWGMQNFAHLHGQILIFSQFGRARIYPYPVGNGDKRAAIEAILADAHERGIRCRITGLSDAAMNELEALFPGRFRFQCSDGSSDYVYDINDLADLKGKKYHAKRNHLNRFTEAFPNYRVEELNEQNLPRVKQMAEDWYQTRLAEDPNSDFHFEREALQKALLDYRALDMEGLVLLDGEEILAFTLASRLSGDTFDVHFEKARADIQGAYAAINCHMARHIREKYPEVRYLDREEDMGIEGLRRAKLSYYPHHRIQKCSATLMEEDHED